jgi:hypothetical protein
VAEKLGKVPDKQIAEQLGCTQVTVRNMRRRLNIPKPTLARRIRPLLGKVPDKEIAKEFNCSRETVCRIRCAEGIRPAPREPHDYVMHYQRELAQRKKERR